MTSIFKHNATQIPILESKFHVLVLISRMFYIFWGLYLKLSDYNLKYRGSKNFEGSPFTYYVDS